jgi:hypothetical protein
VKSNYSKQPAPVPLCRLQIPHDLTRARTQAAVVASRRLIACSCPQMCVPTQVQPFNRNLPPDNLSKYSFRSQVFRISGQQTMSEVHWMWHAAVWTFTAVFTKPLHTSFRWST